MIRSKCQALSLRKTRYGKISIHIRAYGRTIGHEKLANKIKAVAKRKKTCSNLSLLYTGATKGLYCAKTIFCKEGVWNRTQIKCKANLLVNAKEVYEEGYTDIIMVVGSDRVNEFSTLLKKYNGKGDYDFDSINVVSAGQRDFDAKGVEGMSGTKLGTSRESW